MSKPGWLLLIEAWTAEGMGAIGPTLPFVVGALCYRSRSRPQNVSAITALVEEMASTKVPGRYIYVSWCPTVDAPVLSLREAPRPEWAVWSGGKVAEYTQLEFGSDVRSTAAFNCADQTACIRKLAEDAWEPVARGTFSRNRGSSGLPEFGPFTAHEIRFIERTLAP